MRRLEIIVALVFIGVLSFALALWAHRLTVPRNDSTPVHTPLPYVPPP